MQVVPDQWCWVCSPQEADASDRNVDGSSGAQGVMCQPKPSPRSPWARSCLLRWAPHSDGPQPILRPQCHRKAPLQQLILYPNPTDREKRPFPASAFLSVLYTIHSDLEIKLRAQDAADTIFQSVSALSASAAVNEVCHKALQLMPVFMSSAETPLSRDWFFFFFFPSTRTAPAPQGITTDLGPRHSKI